MTYIDNEWFMDNLTKETKQTKKSNRNLREMIPYVSFRHSLHFDSQRSMWSSGWEGVLGFYQFLRCALSFS